MTQFLRDQASDSEEVVTPLMLDGTYLSRNLDSCGFWWELVCGSSSKSFLVLYRSRLTMISLSVEFSALIISMYLSKEISLESWFLYLRIIVKVLPNERFKGKSETWRSSRLSRWFRYRYYSSRVRRSLGVNLLSRDNINAEDIAIVDQAKEIANENNDKVIDQRFLPENL